MMRPPLAAEPFPYAALEAMSRLDVEANARLRRAARAHVHLDALARELSVIVADRVDVLVRRTRRASEADRPAAGSVGVLLELGSGDTAALEVEGTLAALVTAKALSRPSPRYGDPARAASPALAGAFAAVLVACLRRAHARAAPPRVIDAGPAPAITSEQLRRAPASTTAELTVLAGPDAFAARVTIGGAALPASTPAFDGAALAGLGDLPLSLSLVAATCLSTTQDLGRLAPGDAFVAPGLSLSELALVAPRGERGLRADLAEGGRLVIRGQSDHPWEEPNVADDASSMTTAEVLEDAPVVVRVELGAVELRAREWAALSPGDVVTLGKKLGEPAVLRVGGVEVARGELVQVDGEYAVRILETR